MTTTAPTKENAPRQRGAFQNSNDTDQFATRQRAISSPRALRLLEALLGGPTSRESLDRLIGASNTPDVVMRLRQRGFEIPCRLRDGFDRDGRACKYGIYSLTAADADRAAEILAERAVG